MTWSFRQDCKATHLGAIFLHKKVYLFQKGLFDLNAILKTCFKNLFKKTEKKWRFYSFK